MPKASDLKKGEVIAIDGNRYVVKDIQVKSPSSRSGNTLYKVAFRNAVTKQKFEQTYKGDEMLEAVDFSKRPVQLLFQDADTCTFMDGETYEQFVVDKSLVADELHFIFDGMEGIYALIADEQLLGVEAPATVELDVVDTAPGIKGASASARTKPATLSTGLVVQVPEYLEPGERVKINTQTGKFVSRA
ncbi:MAG: elongation factor P-like protein YeiP [Gammaproteobacteria bacterium]|nr:elongation factor P-like protein YeiP [Gammaproteobacteria bacterium]